MRSRRPILFSISLTSFLVPGIAQAVKIEWVPVRASGAYEIHDHEIVLERGGQRVWFEARISGWAPELLIEYYFSISMSAYPPRTVLATPTCDSDADCAAAFDYTSGCAEYCEDCNAGVSHCERMPSCGDGVCDPVASCAGGICERRCSPAYVDACRADFLLSRGQSWFGFGLYSLTPPYLFGTPEFSTLALVPDDGEAKYVGTIVIDFPAGLAGTFALGFGPGSVLNSNLRSLPLEYVAATLTVPCRRDEECDDQNACTVDRCDVETGKCHLELDGFDPAITCCHPDTGEHYAIPSDESLCRYNWCDRLTGTIRHPLKRNGAACGTRGDICNPPGLCETGKCSPRTRPGRATLCGNQTERECKEADSCDGAGHCVENHRPDGTRCSDDVFCNGPDECRSGACVPVGRPRCSGNASCYEERQSCDFQPLPFDTFPPHNGTISGRNHPRIGLVAGERPLPNVNPSVGDFDIRRLLPDGRVGPDFSEVVRMELTSLSSGTGRGLVVRGLPVLGGDWYTLRHVGSWGGLPPFEFHFWVQSGDANGDGVVNAADLKAVDEMIGRWDSSDLFQDRFDVSGDSRVDFSDVLLVNHYIPSRPVPKPSGH